MKTIDDEIHRLEQRMARRRHEVADTARAAKSRALGKLLSPAGLMTAAGLGFLATMGLMRKRRAPVYVNASKVKGGALMSFASLVAPIALALIRAQFGSPAGLAQYVLTRFGKRPSPSGDRSIPRRATPARIHPAR